MLLRDTAHKINELSGIYKIGELQGIRKKLKGLQKRPGSKIFADTTINEKEGWAYHFGGRTEIQFNIGKEKEGLRYGVAFSLETSQTLPDISLLFPKVLKFNQFVRENPNFFSGYSMWHYHKKKRSPIGPVVEINETLLLQKTFIFIGKITKHDETSFPEILEAFDRLLTPYVYIEKEKESGIIEYEMNKEKPGFNFVAKAALLPQGKTYTSAQKAVNLEVRHSLIQEKLITMLMAKWGKDNVAAEQLVYGKKVDVVLRRNGEYDFYEIKTCGSAKACIREALGQLMEYAYWPSGENAKSLIVVGEELIDKKTEKYLDFLRTRFNLPIQYLHLPI